LDKGKKEEVKECLIKLKTIDRRKTPEIGETNHLIEPRNRTIKKTSTNLKISASKSSSNES
jgi:hypothetical protein